MDSGSNIADDIAACLCLLSLPNLGNSALTRLLQSVDAPREVLRLGQPLLEALELRPQAISALRALGGHPDAGLGARP